MENLKTYLAPLGRLLMSSLFIWAGYNKLFEFERHGAVFRAACTSRFPNVAVWVVIVIEMIGGSRSSSAFRPVGSRPCSRYSA